MDTKRIQALRKEAEEEISQEGKHWSISRGSIKCVTVTYPEMMELLNLAEATLKRGQDSLADARLTALQKVWQDKVKGLEQDVVRWRRSFEAADAVTRSCAADLKNLRTPAGALDIIRAAMLKDLDYAWSWHCNIAMAIHDAGGRPHEACNEGAARFLAILFPGVDTSKHAAYLQPTGERENYADSFKTQRDVEIYAEKTWRDSRGVDPAGTVKHVARSIFLAMRAKNRRALEAVSARPWSEGILSDWRIVGMNHYEEDGMTRIYVAMMKDGRCIKAEGTDQESIWKSLAHKASMLVAPTEAPGLSKDFDAQFTDRPEHKGFPQA